MTEKQKLKYIEGQIKDLLKCYIDIDTSEDYEQGKKAADIFCKAIQNESEEFIYGVMERLNKSW